MIYTLFASQLPAGGTVFKVNSSRPLMLAQLYQQIKLRKMRVSSVWFTFWPKRVC